MSSVSSMVILAICAALFMVYTVRNVRYTMRKLSQNPGLYNEAKHMLQHGTRHMTAHPYTSEERASQQRLEQLAKLGLIRVYSHGIHHTHTHNPYHLKHTSCLDVSPRMIENPYIISAYFEIKRYEYTPVRRRIKFVFWLMRITKAWQKSSTTPPATSQA